MADDKLTPEQTIRLLRAKASELGHAFQQHAEAGHHPADTTYLLADVSLLYDIVAHFMERTEASLILYEAHTENLISRVYELEGGDQDTCGLCGGGGMVNGLTGPQTCSSCGGAGTVPHEA